MPSPACNVSDNGGAAVSTLNGVDVANDGTVVTIILADQGGVRTWSCSVVGSDDQVAVPAVTVNETTKTATFTKPAGPWALIIQSQINDGLNNGVSDPTYTTTFGVYIKTASKSLRLGAANERAEGSASFGWTTKVNAAIRAVESAGGGGSGVTWLLGTDAAYQPTAARGRQIVVIPTLTANRTWKFPAAPQDGDQIELDDRNGVMATSGFVISVQGNAGTEHVFAEGADKGTLYAVPNALLGDGNVVFTYRAASTSWEMA